MVKILVVDDEPSLREMLHDILGMEGFKVITAANGEEGLKKIYEDSPDLILLDCSMPVLDGYEVLERMRKDPVLYSKPVIMLTVLSGEYDEIKGLELGGRRLYYQAVQVRSTYRQDKLRARKKRAQIKELFDTKHK